MRKKDEQLVEEALESVLRELNQPRSREVYAAVWHTYWAWLRRHETPVHKANPVTIKTYLADLRQQGKARTTTGLALSVLRVVYGELVVSGVITSNPAREVKNPRNDGTLKTPWLNEEQVKTLLAFEATTWRDRRDKFCLHLLFGLGWRRSEIARLTVEDFDGDTVKGIVKGGKEITVGVPKWLLRSVEEWKAHAGITSGPLLLKSPKVRTAVTDRTVFNIVRRAANRVGIPEESVTPHAFRRSNITLGGKRGVSLKERQLAVGHASSATTERYDKAREAAESAPGNVFEDLVGK